MSALVADYQTLAVRRQGPILFMQMNRPHANNTINDQMVGEMLQVLEAVEADTDGEPVTVVVLEGLPEVFCFGADFNHMHATADGPAPTDQAPKGHDPEPLYDLWTKLATGPFVSISHVRGKVNAGGMGFVAASDIVLADETAVFSLSELLFGLFPACVLPFLIRKIGFQKAHYMTLMTQPVSVQQASAWGLVDAVDANSAGLLRKHLLRLRRLTREGLTRYKSYMNRLDGTLERDKGAAIAANLEIFSDPRNLEGIFNYVETGRFPWER